MCKALSQLRTNDISSMTQVLEDFDPDYSSFFDGFNERCCPNVLGGAEAS